MVNRISGLPFLILAVVSQFFLAHPGLALNSTTCWQISLEHPLSWLSSAIWDSENQEFRLTDPSSQSARKTFTFSLDGRLKRSPSRESAHSYLFAVSDPELGGTEILRLVGNTVVERLGPDRLPTERFDLTAVSPGDEFQIASTFRRMVVAGTFFGFGYLNSVGNEEDLRLAFFARPIFGQASGDVLPPTRPVQWSSGGDLFFSAGFPLMTSIGQQAYFVSMDKGVAKLNSYHVETQELTENLPGFRWRNQTLPPFNKEDFPRKRVAHYQQVYGAIERFKDVPVGIFGQDGLLYVMSRRPGSGGTDWRMEQLAPGENSMTSLGELRLPTSASHLRVVKMTDFWAFFERSSVNSEGLQTIGSMVLIPKPWIEDSTASPLYNTDSDELTCTSYFE